MQFTDNYDDIRPFRNEEVTETMKKLYADEVFNRVLTNIYHEEQQVAGVKKAMLQVQSIEEFQKTFIVPFLNRIINSSTTGITIGGLEELDRNNSYLFISNHRDIILDSALLNVEIFQRGYKTTQIAIGSNLLIYPWIDNLVRVNRSFVVKRGIPVKQMLLESKRLSNYIRKTISERSNSIWIAQREGRSKDGNDQTQAALLKMLNMSNNAASFEEGFASLRIVPMAISYEIEPCGNEKVAELLKRQADPNFKKSEKDDLTSMVSGLKNQKGNIHIQFGKPIEISELENCPKGENTNEQLKNLALYIDKQIYNMYKLFPNNYVAYDLYFDTKKYSHKYTDQQGIDFIDLTHQRLQLVNNDRVEAIELWLKMYSQPVVNFENCCEK